MTSKQQKIDILKSWHAIEFFQPCDLSDAKISFQITHGELARLKNELLPWLSDQARLQADIKPFQECKYILHLAIFDKNETTRASELYLNKSTMRDELLSNEIEERLNDEGQTYFAKLSLDNYGTPNFKELSVSTLPWALGHLKNNSLEKISYQEFQNACSLLDESLNRINLKLRKHPKNDTASTLCADALIALINNLYNWAQFRPSKMETVPNNVLALQLNCYPYTPKPKVEQLKIENQNQVAEQMPPIKVANNSQAEANQKPTNVSKDKVEKEIVAETVLPILNSFFIEDIEWAINSINYDQSNAVLDEYLSIQPHKESDLYTQAGLKLITQSLQPDLMPIGRWPSNPKHNMALMQQFAINTAVKELENGGLLSVNGPPGTGKTTLLRDLIARNITQRAKILASFDNVDNSLDSNGFPCETLSGFEMVVASSNNAAVQNISKELPQIKALGDEFQDIEYLKPIANQLAAKELSDNNTGDGIYHPLEEGAQCWGAITATLGKSANRKNFIDRFFFQTHFKKDSDKEKSRAPEYNFLNLWRWRKLSDIASFSEVKSQFTKLLNEFDLHIQSFNKILKLLQRLDEYQKHKYISNPIKKSIAHITKYKKVSIPLEILQSEIEKINEKLGTHKCLCQLLLAQKWSIIKRLFNQQRYRLYHYKLTKSELKIKKLSQQLSVLDKIRLALNKLALELKNYPDICLPDNTLDIKDSELQRNTFWQNPTINRLRSNLFITALNLHQSWLHEALQNRDFLNNICKIPSLLQQHEKIKNRSQLWQCFFMIVPVISTTFASMSSMFKDVKADEIGWLMIDEAGQAIPQAGVGGMLRAKRVLVVGDPLQVEPVMTTPPSIIKKVCNDRLGNIAEEWDPLLHSLQQIADRANRYGCNLNVMNKKTWIGIPLWVHRRCIEPMFSLSNAMAYNNRMIHGSCPNEIVSKPLNDGQENFWLSSKGKCVEKQFKYELAEDTKKLIDQIVKADHSLSSIYVVTPFKAVKQHLMNVLKEPKLRYNLGTVHTFQGKENDIVILVLGCCPENTGGASWASSKPNLLNVAITRAKKNFFVIGDPDVWKNKPYFSEITKKINILNETN